MYVALGIFVFYAISSIFLSFILFDFPRIPWIGHIDFIDSSNNDRLWAQVANGILIPMGGVLPAYLAFRERADKQIKDERRLASTLAVNVGSEIIQTVDEFDDVICFVRELHGWENLGVRPHFPENRATKKDFENFVDEFSKKLTSSKEIESRNEPSYIPISSKTSDMAENVSSDLFPPETLKYMASELEFPSEAELAIFAISSDNSAWRNLQKDLHKIPARRWAANIGRITVFYERREYLNCLYEKVVKMAATFDESLRKREAFVMYILSIQALALESDEIVRGLLQTLKGEVGQGERRDITKNLLEVMISPLDLLVPTQKR